MKETYKGFQNTLRAFLFVCYTGLRISELLKIKHENIMVFHGDKYLQVDPDKVGDQYLIKLSKKALALIKDEAPNRISGIIFQNRTTQTMNEQIKMICRLGGVNDEKCKLVTFHKARHTFATIALTYGDIKSVSELLNHKSLRTTEIYTHCIPQNKDKIIDKMDSI